MKRIYLLVVLFAAGAAGLWFGYEHWLARPEPLDIAGIYLDEPIPLDDFALTDGAGHVFNRERFRGQWSFLYFGYTYCPDACPLTLSQLNKVEKRLVELELGRETAFWFISVDPRRDKPQKLAEYAAFFNPKFGGITGDQAQLEALTLQLGAFYAVPKDPEDPEYYLVSHPASVYLINPDMEFQAVFTAPLQTAQISADFAKIRQQYERLH